MRSLPEPIPARQPLRRRLALWGLLSWAVLLLHGWALFGMWQGSGVAPAMRHGPVVARVLPAQHTPPPAPAEAPAEPPARHEPRELRPAAAPVVAAAEPAARAQHVAARAASVSRATPAAAAVPGESAVPVESTGLPVAAATSLPARPAAAVAAPPPSGAAAVPVYSTRLPDPATLHYQLLRGTVAGSGELVWQRQGGVYELALQGELQGTPVLGSVSRGVIDAEGVAPLRLAERRRSRELRAANFQREAQRITFSGPQVEYPLPAGAQDRLSWMIQLPAIVEADASLALPGARVTLFVVGTRGDAEAWHFEVQGREALELPAGAVTDALHLLREPRRPYDTRIEVWLDPARQHLPVRAVVTTVPGGQPLEFKLLRVAQAGL